MSLEAFTEDAFPVMDGKRMCPRCGCCEVKVGIYGPEESFTSGPIKWTRTTSTRESLVTEPSRDTAVKWQAWFCVGGCDPEGEHHDWPTFLGYVQAAKDN